MKWDKVELSGLIVLFIGVILLAFTFISAYTFLVGELDLLRTRDILEAFGDALAPLIEAIIRILYLGIMGWIGSIVTIRGVQLLKKERTEIQPQAQQPSTKTPENKPEAKQEAKQEPKQETKEEKSTKTKTEKSETAPPPPPSPASETQPSK